MVHRMFKPVKACESSAQERRTYSNNAGSRTALSRPHRLHATALGLPGESQGGHYLTGMCARERSPLRLLFSASPAIWRYCTHTTDILVTVWLFHATNTSLRDCHGFDRSFSRTVWASLCEAPILVQKRQQFLMVSLELVSHIPSRVS